MRAWPTFAKVSQRVVQVVAHSRGTATVAGFLEYELGRGARIVARVSVVPMTRQNAFAFRAWLHSLRGRGRLLFPVAKGASAASSSSTYTDDTVFSDGTRYADYTATTCLYAAADSDAVTVSGLSSAFTVGGFIKIGNQVARIVSATPSGGNTILGIRPRLREAAAFGASVEVDNVYCEMRLAGPVPQVPIVSGNHSAGFDVDLEEAY